MPQPATIITDDLRIGSQISVTRHRTSRRLISVMFALLTLMGLTACGVQSTITDLPEDPDAAARELRARVIAQANYFVKGLDSKTGYAEFNFNTRSDRNSAEAWLYFIVEDIPRPEMAVWYRKFQQLAKDGGWTPYGVSHGDRYLRHDSFLMEVGCGNAGTACGFKIFADEVDRDSVNYRLYYPNKDNAVPELGLLPFPEEDSTPPAAPRPPPQAVKGLSKNPSTAATELRTRTVAEWEQILSRVNTRPKYGWFWFNDTRAENTVRAELGVFTKDVPTKQWAAREKEMLAAAKAAGWSTKNVDPNYLARKGSFYLRGGCGRLITCYWEIDSADTAGINPTKYKNNNGVPELKLAEPNLPKSDDE